MKTQRREGTSARLSKGASRNSSNSSSIVLLDEEVVHRIAAGEVVDRPASVLKELLENSADAGATQIRVHLMDGGLQRIEVEDNGLGMNQKELGICLKRHATSKIKSLEDLDAINTLGFRGEALAAISSVSRLRIHSQKKGASSAWQLSCEGGSNLKITPAASRQGTKLVIEELFYNTPARKKFLKTPASEGSVCLAVCRDFALSMPNLDFEYYLSNKKGELKKQAQYQSSMSMSQRFAQALDAQVNFIDVFTKRPRPELDSVHILAAGAPYSVRHQKNIVLMVNGRVVYDKRLSYALRECYAGLIEVGQFPAVWMDVRVRPDLVDVNIHPQKREIRWPAGFSIASVAFELLRPHLDVGPSSPSSHHYRDSRERFSSMAAQSVSLLGDPAAELEELISDSLADLASMDDTPIERRSQQEEFEEISGGQSKENDDFVPTLLRGMPESQKISSSVPPFKFASLKVVGEVGAAWLVLEAPEGLILIDQHAAHERVQFEKIIKGKRLIRSKAVLIPFRIQLPLALEDDRDLVAYSLESLSFEVADLALCPKREIEILAVPESDRKLKWKDLLDELFERLEEGYDEQGLKVQIESRLAASLACHGSVRRGQRLGADSIKSLLRQLDRLDWAGLCPHGRPVWKLLSHEAIEKLFHR